MTLRLSSFAAAAALLTLATLAGCNEPRQASKGGKKNAVAHAPGSSKEKEPEFIVGKRTQEVVPVNSEAARGADVIEKPRITAKDPITLQGNAYVTMIGQISINQIEAAMRLFQAENDRFPKDYDEFMEKIIRANNIALPKPPHYQKYGYDEQNHKLVILEYPDLKNP